MTLLKQSTTITIQVGPFLDSTDAVTAETALSPTVEVSKGGAAFAARNSATAIAHDADGWYRVELNATDTNTLGRLIVKSTETGALPVWHEFDVVPANVYDSLVGGTDTLDVQVTGMGAGVVTAAAIATDAIDADAVADGAITAATFAAGAIDAAAIATDAIGAAELAADAVTEIANGVAAPTAATIADAVWDEARSGHVAAGSFGEGVASVQGNVTGSVASVATGGITAGSIAADAIGASEIAADAVTEIAAGVGAPTAAAIADAVWDESTTGHVTAGTFGEQVKTDVDAILADTGTDGVVVAGTPSVNVAQISGDATAADNAEAFFDGTGYAGTGNTIPTVTTVTNGVTVSDKTGFSLSAAGVDAILDDPLTELAAVPAAAPTLRQAIQFLFMALRNKVTTTSTQTKLHNDAGTAIATATVSDDGTTFTKEEFA